jgi:hypothetical protein
MADAAPHQLDLTTDPGWCFTHEAYCDVDYEADEYFTDPIDEPMVWDGQLRGGLPGEEVGGCCGMPVARIAGEWGHTRPGVPPGGHHQARPVVNHG